MRRTSAGFTLIELLIVVVIIGLLVAIAVPKFSFTKEKAYVSQLRSDLRNLATAQEAYWNDYAVYYGGAVPTTQLLYNPSQNVSVTMTEGTVSGWGAKAAHPMTPVVCALFTGTAAPPSPATVDGVLACQ